MLGLSSASSQLLLLLTEAERIVESTTHFVTISSRIVRCDDHSESERLTTFVAVAVVAQPVHQVRSFGV